MNKDLENVFKRILDSLINCDGYPYAIDNADYELIVKALKVLEVIKNKEVQVAIFLLTNSCIGYNMSRGLLGKDLTEEEYGLLREMLRDE